MLSRVSKASTNVFQLARICSKRNYVALANRSSKAVFRNNIGLNRQLQLSHISRWTFSDSKDEVEAEFVDKTPNTNDGTILHATENNDDKTEKATYNENHGNVKQHSFQTETKQLLDIVAHSLYTDKEVFLRELLSNASDALGKTRYYLNTQTSKIINPEIPLEISVFTDKEKGNLVIQDTGIGMSEEELISNLGTIARSGSKAFVKAMAEGGNKQDSIIGQFGVGFYSIFMVCDKVEVYSRPAIDNNDNNDKGFYWTSDGSGEYSIAEASNVERGTKIILHLKDDCKEFADSTRIENVIKKYSSFLEYSIKLNGKTMSSTGAIWSKPSNTVTTEEYNSFYQMISDRNDEPFYTYHSAFDTSQYSASCILYIPEYSNEKFGGRQPSGVSLYCKKVLVSKNCQDIVPEWMRFLRGVIDCDNIPIHISRENMQDSTLMEQIQDTILTKMVDFLNKQSKKDSEKYNKWYKEFEPFIKEGIATYNEHKKKEKICKLVRYDIADPIKINEMRSGSASAVDESNTKQELVSFDEYIEKLPHSIKNDKKEIYYLNASNRESALHSPYIESFLDENIPVLLCYHGYDEYIMKNIEKYGNFKLVGIESANAKDGSSKDKDGSEIDDSLSKGDCEKLSEWFKKEFPTKIAKLEITNRLKSHPCVLNDATPQAIRQFMKQMGGNMGDLPTPPQTLEINPNHDIIKQLYNMVDDIDDSIDNYSENDVNSIKAKIIAKQLINNAFISAGIIEDARHVLPDINQLIEVALNIEKKSKNLQNGGNKIDSASIINEIENEMHSHSNNENNENNENISETIDATVEADAQMKNEKEGKEN